MFSTLLFLVCWVKSIYSLNTDTVQHEAGQKFLRLLDNSLTFKFSKHLSVDGTQENIFLSPDSVAQAYFEIEYGSLPLSLLVEPPCGNIIHWTVNLVEYVGIQQQWRAVDIHGSSSASNSNSRSKSPSFVLVRDANGGDREIELADYRTDLPATFNLRSAPKGLYIIRFESSGKNQANSVIKLAASSDRNYDVQLPKMPLDQRVIIAQINGRKMNLYWKPASLYEDHGHKNSAGKMRYCVIIANNKINKSLKHFCQVENLKAETTSGIIKFDCFYGQNHFQLSDVMTPHMSYSVNVFAVNPVSNRGLAYERLVVPGYLTEITNEIKEGDIIHSKIKSRIRFRVLFFENRRLKANLKFAIVICDGSATIIVSKDGKVIRTGNDIRDLYKFSIRNSEIGRYIITITAKGDQKVHFRAFVSAMRRRNPFPNLPKGRIVKEWPMLRTCNSVTVAWVGVHGRKQYCLYAKAASLKSRNKTDNICLNSSFFQRMNKIICFYKRKREIKVFMWTIKGLEPCKAYDIYVQVKRKHSSQVFTYRNLRVATQCECWSELVCMR